MKVNENTCSDREIQLIYQIISIAHDLKMQNIQYTARTIVFKFAFV